MGTIEGLWRGYSSVCPKGTICWAPGAVTQAGGGSSVPTLLCAKNQANENCEHRSGISQIFWQAMKGILWHVFPTAFSSCPSAHSQDSSPAKTNEAQALMSHCKNSLRNKAIIKRWICLDSKRGTLQETVGHHRGECKGHGMW